MKTMEEQNKGKEVVDTWRNLLGLVSGLEVIRAIADDLKRLGYLADESYKIAQKNPPKMRPKNDILPTLKCGVSMATQSKDIQRKHIQKDTETYGRYI